ncbi:hypothetical protein D3C72_194110 [compost metagenome]
MNNGWTPPSKANPFRPGDEVIFRNRGAVPSFIVERVEANMVFIWVTNGTGRKRLKDHSAADFMLLSEWRKIYGRA